MVIAINSDLMSLYFTSYTNPANMMNTPKNKSTRTCVVYTTRL